MTAATPVTQTGSPGSTSRYTLTLTNTDSVGCPANTFRFFAASSTSA